MSASIDLCGDLLRAGIYINNGYMDWDHWFYIPLLGLAAFFGAMLGKIILQKMHQKLFEKIVAILIFISGFAMVFGSN